MTVFVEVVTDGTPERVLASRIIEMPDHALAEAKAEYEKTKVCTCHTRLRYVHDEKGHIYDLRACAVCGRGLGTV